MSTRTIASMYKPNSGMYGGGTRVHAEVELLPGVRYALMECVEHSHAFRPARIKTVITRYVARFELDADGFWNETSFIKFPTLAKARSAFKACTGGAK